MLPAQRDTAVAVAPGFGEWLASGQIGESQIARWLRRRGWHVLPAYEKEIANGKGPRLFMASGGAYAELVTPDLLAMKSGAFLWVEAKHKTAFTWYGRTGTFQTGVDARHFRDYVEVQQQTGVDVWLMFLHSDSRTRAEDVARWGAPLRCPVGLFGNTLGALAADVDHKSDRYGHGGMLYWRADQLRLVAPLEEVAAREW